jgi:hypothetical protein
MAEVESHVAAPVFIYRRSGGASAQKRLAEADLS